MMKIRKSDMVPKCKKCGSELRLGDFGRTHWEIYLCPECFDKENNMKKYPEYWIPPVKKTFAPMSWKNRALMCFDLFLHCTFFLPIWIFIGLTCAVEWVFKKKNMIKYYKDKSHMEIRSNFHEGICKRCGTQETLDEIELCSVVKRIMKGIC